MPSAQELAHHFGVHDRRTGGHLLDRARELGDGTDPVLEQIADAGLAAQVEQMSGVGLLDVLAEHQNGQGGAVIA